MSKKKSSFHIRSEYAALKAGALFIGVLPQWAAVRFGCFVGWLAYHTQSRARNCARKSISMVMPALSKKEVEKIVRQTFTNIGLTLVEVLWNIKNIRKTDLAKRFPVENDSPVHETLKSGKGVVFCTPHLGNWEFFGARGSHLFNGLHAVGKPASNPLVDEFLANYRAQMGITVCNTTDGVRPMLAALKSGRPLAILIDQHVRTAYAETKFFGIDVFSTSVPVTLAMKLKIPLYLAYSYRDGDSFNHRGYFEEIKMVDTGNHDADTVTNTQQINDKLEEVVRRKPGLWLWTYKRWRNLQKEKESKRAI